MSRYDLRRWKRWHLLGNVEQRHVLLLRAGVTASLTAAAFPAATVATAAFPAATVATVLPDDVRQRRWLL